MKKILILLFCFTVVATLFGTGTRVASFGEISYGDAVEVGTYPGLRIQFTNYFSTSMKTKGDDNNYSGSVVLDLGPGVFATSLNKQSNWLDLSGNPLKTYGLTYAMNISDYNVGAIVNYGRDRYLMDDGSREYTECSRYLGFALGASNDMLDFGIKFEMPKYEETDSDTLYNGDSIPDFTYGGTSFGINARYLPLEIGEFKIIPEIGFETGSLANQDDDVTNSTTQINFNTIIGYKISDKTKALFDVQLFGYTKNTIDYADTLINVYLDKEETSNLEIFGIWKVGVESNIKPWLVGRLGAVKEYNKCTDTIVYWEGDDYIETCFDETFKLTFGLGFKFGRFTIDANFNEELLFSGPNFISGTQQDWASTLCMKYSF